MSRFAILNEIRRLDPRADHQRIVFLSTCYEFPFDTTRSLEFALFRTFAVPAIGGLLDRTGQFQHQAQKRYDDTDILVSELMEWGYDSDRGCRAVERINEIHGRFKIANEDFQYVLSTFIYEPIRWNQRFGWRQMCEQERLAMFHSWREVGRRMNIQDLPDDYEVFERFNVLYEREHYRYTKANHRVGVATRELFVGWFPRVSSPLVRSAMHALMDEPILEAFGFPRPLLIARWCVHAGMRAQTNVQSIRVILRPDPARAEGPPRLGRIWGKPIVFENVPLERHDLGKRRSDEAMKRRSDEAMKR